MISTTISRDFGFSQPFDPSCAKFWCSSDARLSTLELEWSDVELMFILMPGCSIPEGGTSA